MNNRPLKRSPLLTKLYIFTIILILIETILNLFSYSFLYKQEDRNNISDNDKNVLRIIAIGESTTADYFSTESNGAWPRQLEKMLNENGIPARVYNLGIGSSNTNLILARLENQIDTFRPHIAISMMGINDSNVWISATANSFYKHIKLYRIFSWLFYSLQSNQINQFIIPEESFENFSKSVKIIEGFKKNDFSQILHQAESHAKTLSIYQQAQYYAYLALKAMPVAGPDVDKYFTAYHMYRLSLNTNYFVHNAVENQSEILVRLQKWDECFELAKKFYSHGGILNDALVSTFSECAIYSGTKEEWGKILARNQYGLKEISWNLNTTKDNYRRLYKILRSHQIKLIAMQYPLLPPDDLKNYFKKNLSDTDVATKYKDISFVFNKENFQEALKHYKFEEIFTDQFHSLFGHTNDFGHSLIAKNVYTEVLKWINQNKY